MRIAIDTGGTFTDCLYVRKGAIRILKVPSTPQDPAQAIGQALGRILAAPESGEQAECLDIIHGTTVGTNALLERRGARVALVTTAGFEDLLELGRQNRPQLYNFDVQRPPALIPRKLRHGIAERTAADGTILFRPSAAELARLRAWLKKTG